MPSKKQKTHTQCVEKLSAQQARSILRDVLDALYPEGPEGIDWDNEHNADTTDQIAKIFWDKVLK